MHPNLARLSLAALLVSFVSCGSSDDSGSSAVGGASGMALVSCTLGCSGSGGGPLSCSVVSIFVNQDIWLEFSQPVDPATVNKNTFQVVNSTTGQAPSGFYQIDSQNPRRVAFRPQLSFDSTGNPTFGLAAGQSYRLTVPAQSGPGLTAIRSTTGVANSTPLECFVQATLGVNDPVPGPPLVQVFLEPLVPGGVGPAQLAQGAQDVPLLSRLRLEFDDIMNPATLVNPATGESNFLSVAVDLDGDISTSADQIELIGDYTIAIDDVARRTTVTFTPEGGFPSSGANTPTPRKIVLDLPATVLDLGGNSLANAGQTAFTPVAVVFPPTLLPGGTGEDFTTAAAIDLTRTGTLLSVDEPSPGVLVGRAAPGFGGGSGRFGDLIVNAGQTFTLVTNVVGSSYGPGVATDLDVGDLRTFVIDNYDPDLGELPGAVDYVAQSGVFEFSTLVVAPGAVLRAQGSNPPRLLVRGEARISGLVVLAGSAAGNNSADGVAHNGTSGTGQTGGTAAAGGGRGGDGGDRQNATGTPLLTVGGFNHGVGVVVQTNGADGIGRGGSTNAGEGEGGTNWSAILPGPSLTELGGFQPNAFCTSMQVGQPGSGATYGSFGTAGVWASPFAFIGVPVSPGPNPPGAEQLRASDTTLNPEAGLLVGGAGGGGGGLGIAGTRSNGLGPGCPPPAGQSPALLIYRESSAAGGGGGAGAIQIQAGRRLLLDGSIDLRGGNGGRAVLPVPTGGTEPDQAAMTAPGGGGTGGAALLQSLEVAVASFPGVIDLRGGTGGLNPGGLGERNPSSGGSGGAGIARFETAAAQPLDVAAEAAKLLPATGGPGQPAHSDLLSLATWMPVLEGFGARSGLQSCWIVPPGSPFQVDFLADDASDPDNVVYGWNMDLEVDGGIVAAFRGPSVLSALLGQDIETVVGSRIREISDEDLSAAPILVRFQGARVVGSLETPCLIEFSDPAGPFLPGSLTPWVLHPAELNDYWNQVFPGDSGLAAKLKPNAIRYQIVFDRQAGDPAIRDAIQAVRAFFIRVQPD